MGQIKLCAQDFGLSILEKGSFLCCPSWGFFHFHFFDLWTLLIRTKDRTETCLSNIQQKHIWTHYIQKIYISEGINLQAAHMKSLKPSFVLFVNLA